jgi:hypothetical protein
MNYDWAADYVPHAKYLRREMLSRLPPQGKDQFEADELFFGSPAGHNALRDTADRLDVLTMKLCPKS